MRLITKNKMLVKCKIPIISLLIFLAFAVLPIMLSGQQKPVSVYLENMTWVEAEKVLKNYDVVLIGLGARTKEHGPHLLLKNDYVLAEYLKERVGREVPVVILPTLASYTGRLPGDHLRTPGRAGAHRR